jgi:ribose 5-phosphate isomerase B
MKRKFLALAADHRGFKLKETILRFLKSKRIPVRDFGTFSPESCDYPDYILKAAETIRRRQAERAIAVCYTGIGSAIAANKVKGVRAALVQNARQAELSRAHNDSNMLILGSGFVRPSKAKQIVDIWLKTPFEGGRHAQRVRKISDYERKR